MTNKEKAIVMAYTGVCMLTGDKLNIFYEYVEKLMGRPIYTHELRFLADEIKEKAKDDFIELCKAESEDKISKIKSEYLVMDEYGYTDKELVDTVNILVDKVNELNALIQHKSRK